MSTPHFCRGAHKGHQPTALVPPRPTRRPSGRETPPSPAIPPRHIRRPSPRGGRSEPWPWQAAIMWAVAPVSRPLPARHLSGARFFPCSLISSSSLPRGVRLSILRRLFLLQHCCCATRRPPLPQRVGSLPQNSFGLRIYRRRRLPSTR